MSPNVGSLGCMSREILPLFIAGMLKSLMQCLEIFIKGALLTLNSVLAGPLECNVFEEKKPSRGFFRSEQDYPFPPWLAKM